MRLTALGLLAALTACGTAVAQEAAAPAPAPAPEASQPVAPAPETPPAAPVSDATAGPLPAPEPAPAPPAITLPTSGDGAAVISVLERVCTPAVVGGNLDALAKAQGFKKTKNGWVVTLGAKPFTITLSPSGSNPNVCFLTLDYAQGAAQPIVDGLNAWAYLHDPFLKLYRNDEYKNPDMTRRTVSWEHVGADGSSIGLVYVGLKKPDGKSVSKVGDQSTVLFQVRQP